MVRKFWKEKALSLLKQRSVLWLAGVRRVGKTTLTRQIPGAEYVDCELPRKRELLEDIEGFFSGHAPGLIVLDEIHRLTNPSEILKIAADHFPTLKVIATGSSTLAAKNKFRDTLTGRKRELWLLPATIRDLSDLRHQSLDTRLTRGGLPSFLLGEPSDSDYSEWIDSYWAKDVQELFTIDKRGSFMKFVELIFRQSGELFEAQSFTAPCEISRQTAQNYLSILETTLLATVLRPYHEGAVVEIKAQPKIYGFDTGFVCYFKGTSNPSNELQGLLLEHLVLNELLSQFDRKDIFYWRDKQKHEVDFVVKQERSQSLLAIECKLKPGHFSAEGLKSFRGRYPQGRNFLVTVDSTGPTRRAIQGKDIISCGVRHFLEAL